MRIISARILFLGVFLCSAGSVWAQKEEEETASPSPWVDAMMDRNVNVYDAVSLFESYWKDRPIEKGKGWKQFRRWQAFMEPRVYPTGDRPNPAVLYEAYTELQEQLTLQKGASFGVESGPGIGNWTPVGPFNGDPIGGIGRINAIAFHPIVAGRIFCGAPAGGLWRSDNGGQTWTTNTDFLPNLGVSAIGIDPLHPDTMYIGTGDRDAGDTYAIGVLKSTDAGASWKPTGLTFNITQNYRITGMVIHPTQTQTLVLSTRSGIYRSTDGAATWTMVQGGSFQTIKSVAGNGRLLYASTYSNSQIFRSQNFGATWTAVPSSSGLPSSNACVRSELATTAADTNYVYAIFGASNNGLFGVYKSTNKGVTWTQMQGATPNLLDWSTNGSGSGGQAWYDLTLAASPVNKDVLLCGGVNVWRSVNGGANWSLSGHWWGGGGAPFVHADHHALVFKPGTTEVWAGCDGGMYKSPDAGLSWSSQNAGLAITQYYKIAVTPSETSYTLAGSQDNGTHLKKASWARVLGGDGMDCGISQVDPNVMYGSIYYGEFDKSTNGGQSFNAPFSLPPAGSGAWVTPFLVSKHNSSVLYAGFTQVWKSTNAGQSFTATSPALNGSNNLSVLAESPSNPNVLIACYGQYVYRSVNGGSSWNIISNGIGNSSAVTGVTISSNDPNHLWVSKSGFSAGQKVYESFNGGLSWSNVSANLPNTPTNCIIEQPGSNGAVYVGTDLGVFYRDASMTQWIPYMNGLPTTVVNDLEILMGPGIIRAGTYGRGVWESPVVNGFLRKPAAQFSAAPAATCLLTDTVQLIDRSAYLPTAWQWTLAPATVSFVGGTNANSQEPRVIFQAPGQYTVQLIATNKYGSDTTVSVKTIHIGGVRLPFADAMDAAIPERWTVENPDQSHTWMPATVGGTTPGTSAVVFPAFGYSAVGSKDKLVSRPLSTVGVTNPRVVFDVAYRRRVGTGTDSLSVFISTNCGQSWTLLQAYGDNGTGSLASGAALTTAFVPAIASDWKRDSISLAAYASQSGVRIAFVARNNNGNNLYLDNIHLKGISSAPGADFFANGAACANRPVAFYDISANQPTAWAWTFPGGTPATSTMQNPVVVYSSPGAYSAGLTATNASGSGTNTKNGYVTVGSTVTPTLVINGNSTACLGVPAVFTASGTSTGTNPVYFWTVNRMAKGNNGPTFTTSYLQTGDTVRVRMQSSEPCASAQGVLSAPVVMNILQLPTVSAGTYSDVCQGSAPFALAGTPSGGTFSGSGVSGSNFDPSAVGPGTYTVNYTYTSTSGCVNTATTVIKVEQKPVVFFYTPQDTVCVNDPPFTLNTGYPFGGTYRINGGGGAVVNPLNLGPGMHVVSYTYESALCVVTRFDTVHVFATPTKPWVDAYGDSLVCASLGVKYQWYEATTGLAVPGATQRIFKATTPGPYYVRVSVGSCFSESNTFVVVSQEEWRAESRKFSVSPTPTSGPFAVRFTVPSGGEYLLEMFDPAGALVHRLTGVSSSREVIIPLDLSDFPAGVYTVKCLDSHGTFAAKVIKK